MLKLLPIECVFFDAVGDLCEQDACVITLLKSAWHIHPCLLFVSASPGGRSSGPIRCSSSSVWRKPSVSTNASGMYKMAALIAGSGCFFVSEKECE